MIVLLDNGHGGIINSDYQTKGKRSPIWNDGSQLFEGEFNRAIVNGIVERLTKLKIPYVNIAPEYRDVRLETRINRANKYASDSSFFLSIHSNAGGGRGSEIFTSPGNTKSDKIATVFGNAYKNEFPNRVLRTDFTDGDLDKERRFYVLTRTQMPAILTENFFMDNEEECKTILMTKEGRERIIKYHIEAILQVKLRLF
ncbi:N-acetylmuramoyl-L-alanine amidase [Oceanihabitans sp. IOP_32]|uniref:N-acetylmuramoyl-L-alanine amidase n=1 Tax=Oceanihabitans sp. IOP_32 TaxID=2529032 RepID=UPI001293CEA3|nr:N-acetylmuramoyl-L-alanine amidase [Oceanihabitans sp. IOP_32]QFZ54982.1 N-acetylmuramoyl-L-alanine amidase [Oceanihabitans sp. IOP_32]